MEQLLEVLKSAVPEADWENEREGLLDRGVLDSIDIISIVGEMSAEYGIDIPMEEMEIENFNSVDGMLKMIERIQEEG